MVAGLLKHVGVSDLEQAEDIVQETFLAAHRQWKTRTPDHPEAWLFKVSKNLALKHIRDNKKRETQGLHNSEVTSAATFLDIPHNGDELLRMMLACAQPVFSPKQQVIFTLRYAAGFKIDQIAFILGSPGDTITKTLQRIRLSLRNKQINFDTENYIINDAQRNSLLKIIYLMFNEGYKTSYGNSLLNIELCEDALELVKEMIHNSLYSSSAAKALYALMLFNLSRSEARFNEKGDIVDLENQDRSKWNAEMIRVAIHYLNESKSNTLTTYHLEAAIAYLHCTSPEFKQTDWNKIISLQQQLTELNNSPFAKLNLAITFFFGGQPDIAGHMLEELREFTFINNYYLYHVALGKLFRSKQEEQRAIAHFKKAIGLTNSETERRYIYRLLGISTSDNRESNG